MQSVPFPIIRELCQSAGVDPLAVTKIVITPATVTFYSFAAVGNFDEQEDAKVRVCNCKECLDES